MSTIQQRLDSLRDAMRRERLSAFIFPSTDPHQSEYTASHWKGREYVCGFSGSAGTVVVTLRGAALWTDSRYFIAAETALSGSGIELVRMGVEGSPTVAEWLAAGLDGTASPEVGIDGMVASTAMVEELIADLRSHGGITLRTNLDVLPLIWPDRPPLPAAPVELHPEELAGEAAASKLARVRQALRSLHADGMLMARLDDIAWTLNLRGSDVHCTPVFVAYLLLGSRSATLYVDGEKLAQPVRAYLDSIGVAVDDYANVGRGLKDYFEWNILLDPDEVNYTLFHTVTRHIVRHTSPVPAMKAVKNETEQQGFRQAMLRDGVAMVQLLAGLNERTAPRHTELSLADRLLQLRCQQPLFRGPSFDTISAYGAHGAIVHYEPVPSTDAALRPEGFLLLDSGGQYLDGTTDITRTIPLGALTQEQCRVYTLVLKGHLRLQNLVFPDGATGTQLDAVARTELWRHGLNYLHGTGHGVGSYLSVHEGPHQIRMQWVAQPLRAGMVVTCEPGIYLAGRFGVRIENMLLVVPHAQTECGSFLRFEPLTLCPIDKRPILPFLLTDEEREWLDDYHRLVCQRLTPLLPPAEAAWLADACAPL